MTKRRRRIRKRRLNKLLKQRVKAANKGKRAEA